MFTSAASITILGFLADNILGSILGKVSEDLYIKLQGEPAKKAFKKALGSAIQRYAKGNRLALARPLLNRRGLLVDQAVATELMQLVRFERQPDYHLIGEKWKLLVPELAEKWDFDQEAILFIRCLEDELRSTEVYRPVFEAQDLRAIREIATSNLELEEVDAKVTGLCELLDARFSQLVETFSRSTSIKEYILDQSGYIEEKTRGFIGRHWVFEKVEEFLKSNIRGYFFIKGDPGIGKTALAARYVKESGCPHHFTIRAEKINTPETFLRNICAQIIANYSLNYSSLPPNCGSDASFLDKILYDVSKQPGDSSKCVILVDALDESSETDGNPLCLPITLPDKVFILVTMRDDKNYIPRVDCEQGVLVIKHDSSENLVDVADYVLSTTVRSGIQTYVRKQNIEVPEFVDRMVNQSEGNFMYLYCVLNEIEKGAYQNTQIDKIPLGLQGYYHDHWKRMRGVDDEAWFRYKLPVILALTVVLHPIPIDLISKYSGVTDRSRIRSVLSDWSQFLHSEEIEWEGQKQKMYRLYHASFYDFISNLQDVKEERVDLANANARIAKIYWDTIKKTDD